MNKKIVLLSAIIISLFLIPLTGNAEGKFGLGPRAGLVKSNDASGLSLFGGGQIRWKIFPAMSLEGTFDYRAEESYSNNRKINTFPILTSALFYPVPGAKISPYFLGGVGWYFSKIEDSSGSSTWFTPGLHLGGGLDFPLNPNLVFNVDIRYYFLNYGDDRVKNLNTDGFIISAGLTFYLW